MITHCAPDLVQHVIDPSFASDRLTNFLRYVDENLHFRHWYFGHYHVDRRIDRRHTALYDWILPLTEEEDNADQAE